MTGQIDLQQLATRLKWVAADPQLGCELDIRRDWARDAAKRLIDQNVSIKALEDELLRANSTLEFVERWAVHHGSKPGTSAEAALAAIQHYPAIAAITDSYDDGKRPATFDPYARIAALQAEHDAADKRCREVQAMCTSLQNELAARAAGGGGG